MGKAGTMEVTPAIVIFAGVVSPTSLALYLITLQTY